MTLDRQDYRDGMELSDLSAEKLQRQSDLVQGVDAIAVEWPLTLNKGHRRVTIGLDPSFLRTPTFERTVVIAYVASDHLQCYGIHYVADPPRECPDPQPNPPVPCGIEVESDVIVAYPDFGLKVADYSPLVWSGEIAANTVFIKIYKQSGTWLAKLPSAMSSTLMCRITNIANNPNAGSVEVQFLKYDEQNGFQNDGEPMTIRIWPEWRDDAYAPFAGRPDIFEAVQFGGQTWLKWKMRMVPIAPPSGANVVTGDCP